MILRHVKSGEILEAFVREDGRIRTAGIMNAPEDHSTDFKVETITEEELQHLLRHPFGESLARRWEGYKPKATTETMVTITLPTDENGFLGRECPSPDCEGYFKILPETGLTGENLSRRCPYCGHAGDSQTFHTKEQITYAKSVAFRSFEEQFFGQLKNSLKGIFKASGRLSEVYEYAEKDLETVVVCDRCTLRYAIYGVFAFCPDCGTHNSFQILAAALDLTRKKISLSGSVKDVELSGEILADALKNSVAAFDGFGRETMRVWGTRLSPPKVLDIHFQNLDGARQNVVSAVNFDIAKVVDIPEWEFVVRCFQKRHLLAHTMGVVDEEYLRKTKDPAAIVGRKISITAEEVQGLTDLLIRMGQGLAANC